MGVEIDGLGDMFEDLDDLEDDYGDDGENWQVGTNVEYAIYLEFGTSSHVIEGDPLLYFENESGQLISKKRVRHPGNDPKPFFRPAVNEVRLQGGPGFIRHNTRKQPEQIDSTREYVATLDQSVAQVVRTLRSGGGSLHLISSVKRRPDTHGDPLSVAHCLWMHADDDGDGNAEQTEAYLFRNDDGSVDVYAHYEASVLNPEAHLTDPQTDGDPEGVVTAALYIGGVKPPEKER